MIRKNYHQILKKSIGYTGIREITTKFEKSLPSNTQEYRKT